MSYSVESYHCEECGTFAVTVERPVPDHVLCEECGATATWRISAPMGRCKISEVVGRGKESERPPGMLDTRSLAEGEPLHEWKARERKKDIERRRKKNREMLS